MSNRRRRPAPRRIVGLHPVTPRRTKPAPRRPATAAKERGVPREFRDPATLPLVKERCGWRKCTSGPFYARPDQEYCCPAHRLKAWRDRQQPRSPAGARQDLPHVVGDEQGVAEDAVGEQVLHVRDERFRGEQGIAEDAVGEQDLPHVAQVGPDKQDLPHVEDLRGLPHVAGLQGLPSVDVDGLEDPDLEDPRVAGDDDDLEDRRRARQDPQFRAWARERGLL